MLNSSAFGYKVLNPSAFGYKVLNPSAFGYKGQKLHFSMDSSILVKMAAVY